MSCNICSYQAVRHKPVVVIVFTVSMNQELFFLFSLPSCSSSKPAMFLALSKWLKILLLSSSCRSSFLRASNCHVYLLQYFISNSRYSLQLLDTCLRVISDIYDKMLLFSLPADYSVYLVLIVGQGKVDRQHFHSLDAVLVVLC